MYTCIQYADICGANGTSCCDRALRAAPQRFLCCDCLIRCCSCFGTYTLVHHMIHRLSKWIRFFCFLHLLQWAYFQLHHFKSNVLDVHTRRQTWTCTRHFERSITLWWLIFFPLWLSQQFFFGLFGFSFLIWLVVFYVMSTSNLHCFCGRSKQTKRCCTNLSQKSAHVKQKCSAGLQIHHDQLLMSESVMRLWQQGQPSSAAEIKRSASLQHCLSPVNNAKKNLTSQFSTKRPKVSWHCDSMCGSCCVVACVLTLPWELLSQLAKAGEAVCSQLAQDARQHLCQLFGLSVACDGEGVSRQRCLNFGVVEMDHRPVIFYHVDLIRQNTACFKRHYIINIQWSSYHAAYGSLICI